MIKIMVRILVILLAVGLVSGALYLVVNGASGGSSLSASGLAAGAQLDGRSGGNSNPGFDRQGNGFRGERDGGDFRGGFSLARGLAGTASNLLIVALIVAAVAVIRKIANRPALNKSVGTTALE
jgi:hypothetical protein